MRRTAVNMGALTALLLGGALVWGQSAPPAKTDDKPKEQPTKSKLEEMLQKALRDNPDLRLAAAKVAEAEAELNRSRLLVVQKVSSAYQAVEAQKAAVEGAKAELDEMKASPGAVAKSTVRAAEQKLIDAKVKLAALEAEMPYLLGKQEAGGDSGGGLSGSLPGGGGLPGGDGFGGGIGGIGGGLGTLGGGFGALGGGFGALGAGFGPSAGGDEDPGAAIFRQRFGREPRANEALAIANGLLPKYEIQASTADRIRAALDTPISLQLKEEKPSVVLEKLSEFLHKKDGPSLLLKVDAHVDGAAPPISVHFDDMPLGVALEYVEDSCPSFHVVVREYGLVFAEDNALPPGAPMMREFWKGAKANDKAPAKEQSANPPADSLKGLVKAVDAAGLVRISLGSDAGIAKGNTMEVYRLNAKAPDQSKYLGRIKIVETTAQEAVGQPVGKMTGPVQAGDQVSSRILGD